VPAVVLDVVADDGVFIVEAVRALLRTGPSLRT
jgi:hypothetical protein